MLQILIYNEKGSLIVEILVVIAIIAFAFAGLFGLVIFSLDASHLSSQNTQAKALVQEEIEALRNFRDGTTWSQNGLGVLTTGQNYYLQASGGRWQLALGQETIGNFTRKIIFSDVQRDVNSNIVSNGGVNDPETKKAGVSVSWTEKGRPHQISISTYFTNWGR